MKVLMLASYPIHQYAEQLGIARGSIVRIAPWNQTLAEWLVRTGDVDLHVVTMPPGLHRTRTVRGPGFTLSCFGNLPRVNVLTLYFFTRLRIRRLLKKLRPDVVHGIGIEHIWPYLAVMSGYPNVITVHGILSDVVSSGRLSLTMRERFLAGLEPVVMRKARHMICISPHVIRRFGEYYNISFHTVENAVQPMFFESSGHVRERNRIAFVGDIIPRKGLHFLIEALTQVRADERGGNARLSIAGAAPGSRYLGHLMRLVGMHKLDGAVDFAGFLLPEQIRKLMASIAVLVLPSLVETAPSTIGEAMACGTPVIATNVGGVNSMIENGQTGFVVEAGDTKAMADRMCQLISDRGLWERMSANCSAVALQRWHPKLIAEKTLGFIALFSGNGGEGRWI